MRQVFPQAYICHMDDLLLATYKEEKLQYVYNVSQDMLHKNGIIIAPEKVQRSDTVIFGTTSYQNNY